MEPQRLHAAPSRASPLPTVSVLGKMGHTERYSPFVGKNIYGEKYQPLFANGVKYFK